MMEGQARESKPGNLPDAGGIGGLLSQPNRVQEDCNLIRRAISEGWPVPPERRQRILDSLQQIVETDTFVIERLELNKTGDGLQVREQTVQKTRAPNHSNQIKAAKTIIEAFKTTQADIHHVEDHNQRERHHADDRDQKDRHIKARLQNSGLALIEARKTIETQPDGTVKETQVMKLYGREAPLEDV